MRLRHFEDAVFLLLCAGESGEASRGTGFAVGDGSVVVTAAHVVRGHQNCVVLRGTPTGDHWGSKGRVTFLEDEADVGIVRLEKQSPGVLQLKDRSPTEMDHLLVWDWPAWQEGSKPLLERDAQPRALAALYTSTWTTRRGARRFGFAARTGHGMSGGPIVNAETGDVLGLVIGSWQVDEHEVVEKWWDNIGDRYEVREDAEIDPSHLLESMKAHLALGLGIGVPADCIGSALRQQ